MSDITERAEGLDKMREKGIAEKLTLEEADNIVHRWGVYLEYSGSLTYLFTTNIPASALPYPIELIQGALNKMEAYYHSQGMHEAVESLEATEALLMWYTDDADAVQKAYISLGDDEWKRALLSGMKDLQRTQLKKGYLVNKELWGLSEDRLRELGI